MHRKEVTADMQGIRCGLDFIEDTLKEYKIKKKEIQSAILLAEESMVTLIAHRRGETGMKITVSKRMGSVSVKLSCPGEPFDLSENGDFGIPLDTEEMDHEAEMAIRGMILKSFDDRIRCKHKNGWNTVNITARKAQRRQLYLTLGSLVLAILLGFLFKAILPEKALTGLNGYLLVPVKTMFLNALKMVVGPVVFFSIVSCVSQFGSLTELGKMGAKVFGLYLFTTVLAIGLGFGVFQVFQPGDPSLLASVSDAAAGTAAAAAGTSISILDTVVGIVPANIVKPFLETNMLQIIFIALLCGIAVGMIGDYSKGLREFFEACNSLFLKITTLIINVIPLAVFCSMTSLVLTTGTDTLISLMGLAGTFLAALVGMITVYCLLILLLGRVSPLPFLKKFAPAMLTTFSLSSSNAAMTFNMKTCRENLGISSKVCSFSIPLGATINMDGSCIYMMIAGLFMARIYGIELSGAQLFSMIFAVFVLSVGAPGIPGSGLVCASVLLVQIGVPVEALSLIMGIDPIFGMFRAASNSTGDAAVSLIVAKTEGLLDREIYFQS